MADLDELRIRINADSGNAQRSIDGLIQRLGKLSASLGGLNVSGLNDLSRGVSNLNAAMNGLGGQANDAKAYRNLANNIRKLTNINTSNISAAGMSLRILTSSLNNLSNINVTDATLRLADLAKSISKLGGANATRAVTTIPQLATAMTNMMQTLSTAPIVSRNVIELANAMANLASQGTRMRTATNALVPNMNHMGHAARNIRPHINGLASAFGRFYASCFLAIRAIKGLWGAIEKSMDYIEVLNYFNAAIEQVVSKADLSKWEELGYESAEAYAQSFGKGIESMSEKMTGYTQDLTGRLIQINGAKSLGINATDLLGASTNFLQIASSMGVASDNAEKLSTVLTELGADIASVKNQDFTTVWQKLQSGLVGMSRAVDAYGVNLRNANLQAELANIGINTSVSNFGQQEKALLRVIVLLKDTEFAYGDLADTIQQPANQVRMLKASFENFSRSLGNIFLPIVAQVIPYITMLTNALTRLNEYIVSMLGFAGFDWGGSSTLPDIVSDALDAEDALDDAAGAAGKLKKALQGFDELNNITTSDASGSGGLVSEEDLAKLQKAFDEAVERYQKRWDEAFANMADTYNSFADNVAKAFKEGGMYGVGKYLSDKIAETLNNIDWEEVRSKVNNFASGFAEFLNGLISPEAAGAIGNFIAQSLNTLIDSAFTFGSTMDWDNLGDSALSGLDSFFGNVDWAKLAQTLNIWVQGLAKVLAKIVGDQEFWNTVFGGLSEFFENLDVETVGLIIGAVTIVRGANLLTGAIGAVLRNIPINNVTLTLTAVTVAIVGGVSIGNNIGQMIAAAMNDSDALEDFQTFKWFGDDGFFDTLFDADSFGEWFKDIFINTPKQIIEDLKSGDASDWDAVTGFFLLSPLEGIGLLIEMLWNDTIKPAFDDLWTNISDWWDSIPDIFKMSPFQGIATLISDFWTDNIQPVLDDWIENIKNALWGDNSIWVSITNWWSDTVEPFFKDAGTSIWEIIKGNLNNIIDGFENFCNKVIDGIDAMIGQIVGSFKIDLPDYVNNTMGIPDITVGAGRPLHVQFTRLAEGGIATSSTIANIGEAGKEAVLPLERNTGWMDTLADRLVASMNQQGGGGSYTFVAELDGNTLFEETVRQNEMWRNQTGRNAFA